MAKSSDRTLSEKLQKLVLERDNWNFALNDEFEFRTVYRIAEYSYKMCSCVFEHELFSYLLDSGEVDTVMFEKILKCINDEECPHVQDADDDFVTKTTVHGMHALAAMGDEKLLNKFNLNPVVVEDNLENGLF